MEYELMLLFKPLTNEDIKERIFPKIEKVIKDFKGSIKIRESIGKRLLAYDIKGNKEGFYLLCDLSLSSAHMTQLRDKLNLTSEILRFIAIRKDQL